MNKEIEELADDIYWEESKFEIVTKSYCEDLAETLYDLGYRNQDEIIKEFAEKLKAKLDEQKHFYEVAKIGYKDISLAALNTTYKMLDDLLKEYGVENE